MDARKEAERQAELLARGTAEIVPEGALLDKLERSIRTGTPLRVKIGIDPTGKDVHIGHMVPYGKLRQFQDLGHRAVLIIGDCTASIGDPTGRNAERPALSVAQVRENAERYADQIFKVVDRRNAEIRWQSEWYGTFGLGEFLSLAGSFSLAQLLAHETFRKRYSEGVRVGIHEIFYPLLQAYDSIAVGADVELGGTDQKFNILAGRDLQKERGMEAQCAVLMPLLPGLDGRKMSKSFGNEIPVSCSEDEQFARVMSIADECIAEYRRLVFLAGEDELVRAAERIASGENPMKLKLELAADLVDRLNGNGAGAKALAAWKKRFSERKAPEEMPSFTVFETMKITNILVRSGLASSASEGRRLIAGGAVYLSAGENRSEGETAGEARIGDPNESIDPAGLTSGGRSLRIGRRRYVRLVSG